MPKHLSNLKDVYKKTYEELKNPKSNIGIFLRKIDGYNVNKPEALKAAVRDFIKVYEAEEKNFVEPDETEKVVSYEKEMERLKKNLEVEKKLADAVQKMQDALDILAVANIEADKTPTPEEIKNMQDKKEKLKAQRDRVLNATYKLEVEREKELIDSLKKDFVAFDHRPLESEVPLPPYIIGSSEYKFRHMELDGSLKVPTAIYGMIRVRDLLENHEKMVAEAERSRQYEKFVIDRLAGYQAWQNTLKHETMVYNEIKQEMDPEYFEEYNTFMDDVPASSTRDGYIRWFEKTDNSIKEMEDQIRKFTEEQKSFDDACVNLNEDIKLHDKEQQEKINDYDEKIKALSNTPELSESYLENNNITRKHTEEQLKSLEEQLVNMDEEIRKIEDDQKLYRENMLKNVQQVASYGDELKNLQEALDQDPLEALRVFKENHQDVIKNLDESLQRGLEDISNLGLELSNHNGNIKNTEDEVKRHTEQIDTLNKRVNEILSSYDEKQKKADKDLDKETTFLKRVGRTFAWKSLRDKLNKQFDDAFEKKWELDEHKDEMNKLATSMEAVEQALSISQQSLESYKLGWDTTKRALQDKINENFENTQIIKDKLEKQAEELDKVTLEYDSKVKEIKEKNEKEQELHQEILGKTASEFDKMNAVRIQKSLQRDKLLESIQAAKDKIKECDKNVENIQKAKDNRDNLMKEKEKFIEDGKVKRTELEKDLSNAQISASNAKLDLANLHAKYDIRIENHNKLKNFFHEGKVTSRRIFKDLSAALNKSMEYSERESKKQANYMKKLENKLMKTFMNKMMNKDLYANRIVLPTEKDAEKAKVEKEAKPFVQINGRIDGYTRYLNGLKTSNSKEFNKFKDAILKQYTDWGDFLQDEAIKDATEHKVGREKTLKNVIDNLKEVAETADAYLKAKGSASRFTEVGKQRYRFAEEMKADAEFMLRKFAKWENEKKWIKNLETMNDSELSVSKDLSFYKTATYDMTKDAFVKYDEFDKADFVASDFKRSLPERLENKEVKTEDKEVEIKKADSIELNKEEEAML